MVLMYLKDIFLKLLKHIHKELYNTYALCALKIYLLCTLKTYTLCALKRYLSYSHVIQFQHVTHSCLKFN